MRTLALRGAGETQLGVRFQVDTRYCYASDSLTHTCALANKTRRGPPFYSFFEIGGVTSTLRSSYRDAMISTAQPNRVPFFILSSRLAPVSRGFPEVHLHRTSPPEGHVPSRLTRYSAEGERWLRPSRQTFLYVPRDLTSGLQRRQVPRTRTTSYTCRLFRP